MSNRRTKQLVGLIIIIVININLAVVLMRDAGPRPALTPADATPVVRDEALTYTPVISSPSYGVEPEPMPAAASDYLEVAPLLERSARIESSAISDQPDQDQALLVADIAVEADYEYFAKTFRGNLVRATNYVTQLLSAVSAIYERDIHVRLRPTFIRIATRPDDPWSAKDSNSQLVELKKYWMVHDSARPRAAVLFLSGRNLGGGLAYRSGLCTQEFGYAVVSSVRGSFTTMPSNKTWDLISVAHELGHIFGSKHSHCYKRGDSQAGWYDQCYSVQEASGCYSGPVHPSNGTIMSYCYVSGGSMSRINPISFSDGDPVMVSVMRRTAEAMLTDNPGGCLDYANGSLPLAGGK